MTDRFLDRFDISQELSQVTNTYTVKDAGDLVPAGLPRFAIYRHDEVGARLVALVDDEPTARRIASLLQASDNQVDDQVDDANNSDPNRSARDGRPAYPAWLALQ